MDEKNGNEEQIKDSPKKIEIDPHQLKEINLPKKYRLLFFVSFIIITFLFNLVAMGLVNDEFKYKTFYLKMFSFFILCIFPITQYDKMKSIVVFLPPIVLFYFHLTFIELSPKFLSFLSYFTKIYALAYLRIWIEQFSMIKYKTIFMYILNIIALSGDKISIVICKFISFKENFNKILIVQFLIFIGFFFTPDIYFFVHKKFYHFQKEVEKNEEKTENKENEKKDIEMVSIFINAEMEEKEKKLDEESEIKEKKEQKEKEQKENKINYLFQIFYNFCYFWSILGKANIYFLVALIDYALVEHCTINLTEEKKNKILQNYEILISILAVTGSITGGVLTTIIGGYEKIKSCLLVAIASTITILSDFLLMYSNSYFSILLSISLLFFFINVTMGNLEGYIVQSVPLKYKEFGLNFCGLISTIFCFLSRSIYDYIKITFEKSNKTFAFRFCLMIFIFGYFCILLASTFRYRDLVKLLKKLRSMELDNLEDENVYKNNENNDDSSDEDKNDEIEFSRLQFNSRKTFDSLNS